MADRYVGSFTADLEDEDGRRLATLLWGDPVHVLAASGSRTQVLARGWSGWVATSDLSEESLLEIYVIDVGQGDGVLVKTPAGKWFMVDAGRPAGEQMTKKGAANFVRWKFIRDLRLDAVALDFVVLSHPDRDHYGGFIDVLGGRLFDGSTFDVEVGTLYHSGMGRFGGSPQLGETETGEVDEFPQGFRGIQRAGTFHTELLSDRDSFADPPRPFQGDFAEYAALVAEVPGRVQRVTHRDEYLPGYGPGDGELTIRVLGPILERFDGRDGLRRLEGDDAKTLNGHSVVLRLDYGAARLLLTGDLNAKSQQLLLSYQPDEEFAVDVAKACHHGAEDVHLDFLAAMQPRATVVSSGDNEDYSHPRPVVMGASGRYGREGVAPDGDRVPPLVYSTELARSVKLAYATSVRLEESNETADPEDVEVMVPREPARYDPLERTPLSSDLVYGLVNVRTDGRSILCATLEEKGNDFDVKVITAGA